MARYQHTYIFNKYYTFIRLTYIRKNYFETSLILQYEILRYEVHDHGDYIGKIDKLYKYRLFEQSIIQYVS